MRGKHWQFIDCNWQVSMRC